MHGFYLIFFDLQRLCRTSFSHSPCVLLLGEIDRCLKKVQEGVETFEDIWQKVFIYLAKLQVKKFQQDMTVMLFSAR